MNLRFSGAFWAAGLIGSWPGGAGSAGAAETLPYLDPAQPVEVRVADLLGRLSLEEKVSLIHGDSKFTTAAIPRLGIPRRWLSDGPHGVREDVGPDTWAPAGHTDDFSTAMPAAIALAATWDPDLGRAYGEVLGSEARKRGKQILLGPGVNIQRTPLGGRNFEFLGEDPWLASRMAVGYIRGVQSQGVASCVKHFAVNNQETDRNTIDVEVGERALREIYLPAFRAAVQEGGVLAVMGAYNLLRGQHCCENAYLLNQVLKGEWGFQGLVVSDWNGTHDTGEAVRNGLDLEMGTNRPYQNYYLAGPFLEGLKQGVYPVALLDEKVRRNLRVMFLTQVFDHDGPAGSINTAAHQATARKVAESSLVLLKNEGSLLPLDASQIRSVAVIGDNAIRLLLHSGGSSALKAFYEVTPLEGILRRMGASANVTFSQGYVETDVAQGRGKKKAKAPADAAGLGREELIDRAVQAARAAEVAIVVGGLDHLPGFDCEGADRKDLSLPYGQDELIRRVIAANPRTIVVLFSGGAVDMSAWLDRAPAVLQAWYPGMEGGNALAAVICGDVDPSGKLPCTFPQRLADSPAHALGVYPGQEGKETYAEGLLVGYRWFDTKKIEPLFPFGFGLSYTRFAYSDLQVRAETGPAGPSWVAEFTLANVGGRSGAEVAQLYLHEDGPSVERPEQELKGFRKVALAPGEKRVVSIPLTRRAFAFYDPERKGWVAEKGTYRIRVGGSSRAIALEAPLELGETTLEK